MNYPTPQAYNEALQMAQLSILDPTLRSGRVETDALGLPFGRTGSFAITFKIAAGGGNYAFRCFLQNRATIHERYDAISSHLKSVQLPYFVDFSYLDAGIRVDGTTYPTVRMSWAGGIPLGLYIQDHHTDTGRMTALHQQIQGLALALGAAGLAHGDIQGGNLLIADGGAIKLVDYDGMYVPAIASLGAIETGHPNFQHPERAAKRPFDSRVDQFSFALLHTVIAALIENPGLWAQLNSDPDKILLGERDLVDPFSSPAFASLTQLPSSGRFAQSLQAISAAPYGQVPDFTDFLNHRNIPTDRNASRTQARPSAKDTGSSAPWYADYVPGAAQTAGTAGGALGTYIAALPVVDAADPTTWVGSGTWEVEVIGQIADVEIGESGKELPYARLTVRSGDPALSVDLWAEGIRRFAEQGTTVDDAWTGQWISARGTLQGPIGSPTGSRYSMTITQPERLERITAQQARWRLTAVTGTAAPVTAAQTGVSNTDALGTLSGKSSKPSSPAAPATWAHATLFKPSIASGSKSNFSTSLKIVTAILGALLLLLIIAALVIGGSRAASDSNAASQPDTVAASEPGTGSSSVEPVEEATGTFELYYDPGNNKPVRWDRCSGPLYVSVDYGTLSPGERERARQALGVAIERISSATKTNYELADEVSYSGSLSSNRPEVNRRDRAAILVSFTAPTLGEQDWKSKVRDDGSASISWYDLGQPTWEWNYIKQAAIQINPDVVNSRLAARLMFELGQVSGLQYLGPSFGEELMSGDLSRPGYGAGDMEGLAILGDKPCN